MTKVSNAIAIALNRFGLGARPGDAAAMAGTANPAAWLLADVVRFQPQAPPLATVPGSAAMVMAYRQNLVALGVIGADGSRRGDAQLPRDDAARQALRQQLRQQYREGYALAVQARLNAALATPAPFAERLVHFWANHFAVSVDKLAVIGLAGPLEFEAIRPRLFGRFADLLLAVTRHPAMLLYLDQAQSISPDSVVASMARQRGARRQPGLNENLAREILELHTLGAGNYTQADVAGLARTLTGWSIAGFLRQRWAATGPDGSFLFQPLLHDPGAVTVAGRHYPPGGQDQAEAILGDLAVHPFTARHLATKLARHFVADAPPPALVDRLATAHLDSGGDLMAVYKALVTAPESWAQPLAKFKTPWDWLVSALRGTGVAQLPDQKLVGALAELGQPVWRPGSPAGWDDVAASWAAPDALLRRVELAARLGQVLAGRDARALAAQILPGTLSAATAAAIARADSPAQGLALLLASPEFLRR